jgi:Domain of unknown function (DUF4350)
VSRRVWIVIGSIAGVILVLNLLATGLDRAVGGNEPSGVSGSSYSTADGGLAAYASLLGRFGHPVTRSRGPISAQPLDPASTVVVLDPSVLTREDTASLLQFVTAGGRLVIGGSEPFYLHNLRDDPPTWKPDHVTDWRDVDPTLGGARQVLTRGTGVWSDPGSGHTVVHNGDVALVTRETIGRGEIVFVADPSALGNEFLGSADNAAFALALAGADGRPVVFAEGVHGFGRARGIRAIPGPWKAALLLLALAALALAWSRARRLGPPDQPARRLPPPRADYVEALSLTLERTRDPTQSFAPLRGWVRDHVSARSALPATATDDDVAHAAHALGYPDDEISALIHPLSDDESVLALGRLVARVGADDRRNP